MEYLHLNSNVVFRHSSAEIFKSVAVKDLILKLYQPKKQNKLMLLTLLKIV
jgi:hypothetical protein